MARQDHVHRSRTTPREPPESSPAWSRQTLAPFTSGHRQRCPACRPHRCPAGRPGRHPSTRCPTTHQRPLDRRWARAQRPRPNRGRRSSVVSRTSTPDPPGTLTHRRRGTDAFVLTCSGHLETAAPEVRSWTGTAVQWSHEDAGWSRGGRGGTDRGLVHLCGPAAHPCCLGGAVRDRRTSFLGGRAISYPPTVRGGTIATCRRHGHTPLRQPHRRHDATRQLQTVLGVVGLATSPHGPAIQTGLTGDRDPSRRLFAKTGLIIRAGARFTLTVPAGSPGGLGIGCGNSARPHRDVVIAGCPDVEHTGWLSYPGGFWINHPACVSLVVRAGGRTQQVHIGLGVACPG